MAKSYQYFLNGYNKKFINEYNNTLNSYQRYINDYEKYVPSSFNYGNYDFSPDKQTANHVTNAMLESDKAINYARVPENRSAFDRITDAINVGQYASVGLIKGLVNEDMTPWEGMTQGLLASNPFGDGHEKWEHQFSDVLEDIGWKPETLGGKIAKGAVGFVGDVLLDPLTYVSGGMGALVKGSGKASAKVALKGADTVGDITKGMRMTGEIAEEIVSKSKVFKSGLFDMDLADEATKLVRDYNKLIGVNDKIDDVVLSLANAPFGKKLFGHYADKSVTLISSDTMKKLGDMTFAPGYAKIRDSILGGKVGQMFSTNHKLYKLSKTDPEAVFNALKSEEARRGLVATKMDGASKVHAQAEILKQLTPSEMKEVIEVMEDKTKWHKITEVIRFRDRDEANQVRKLIEHDKIEAEKNLTRARKNKSYNKKRAESIFDTVDEQKKVLEVLEQQRIDSINKIRIDKIAKEELLDDVIVQIKNTTDEMEFENVVDINTSIEKYNKYIADSKQFDIDMEARNRLLDAFHQDYVNVNNIDLINDPYKLNKLPVDENDLQNAIYKLNEVPRTTRRRYTKDLNEFGYVRVTKGMDKTAKQYLEGWETVWDGDGFTRFYPPKDKVMKNSFSVFEEAVQKDFMDKYVGKKEFIDDLSKHIFGREGMISHSSSEHNIDKIVKMIEKGSPIDELASEIFTNKELYNGASQKMYSFVAKQIGYDNWNEYFTKPMKEFTEFEAKGGKLSVDDKNKVAELLKKNMNRQNLIKIFRDVDARTHGDVEDVINLLKNKEVTRSLDDMMETIVDGSGMIPLKELERAGWDAEAFLDEHKSGIKRQYHKTEVPTTSKIEGKNRQDAISWLVDQVQSKGGNLNKAQKAEFNRLDSIFKSSKQEILTNQKQMNDLRLKIYGLEKIVDNDTARLSKIDALKKELGDLSKKNVELYSVSLKAHKAKPTAPLSQMQLDYYDEYVDHLQTVLKDRNLDYGQLTDQERVNLILNEFKYYKKGNTVEDEVTKSMDAIKKERKRIAEEAQKGFAKRVKRNSIVKFANSNGEIIEGVVDKVDDIDDLLRFTITDEAGKLHEVTERGIKSIVGSVEPRSLDDLRDANQMYNTFVVRQKDLYDKLDAFNKKPKNFSEIEFLNLENADELAKLNIDAEVEISEVNKFYNEQINKINKTIEDLEIKGNKNYEKYQSYLNDDEVFSNKIKEMDEAINNVEALEVYAKLNYGVDVDVFHEEISKIILDPDLDISPNSRNAIENLREEFLRIGKEEMGIGELSQEQFEAMAYGYLPHILTPEGEAFFANQKSFSAHIKNFGSDFGYNQSRFDVHSRSRKLKNIIIDGVMVENPTIEQINKFYSDKLKGAKLFQENVADIYIARALKHNDLMYNNTYMENMLEVFGEDFTGELKEGYKTVMNHGMLKKYQGDIVSKNLSLSISDNISKHLKDNNVIEEILEDITINLRRANYVEGTTSFNKMKNKLMDKEVSAYIDKYMKETLTSDVRKEMYNGLLENFLKNSNTAGLLDDIALPLSELDDTHISGLNNAYNLLRERYERHIIDRYASLFKIKKTSPGYKHLTIDGVRSSITNIASKETDELLLGRINRIVKKIDDMDSVRTPQIKQINTVISDKANQARKLQIIRDNNGLLDLYDKFTHFIKLQQTTVLPTFHIRNAYSNKFNNWMAVGNDAFNLDFQKQTFRVMRGTSNADDILEIMVDGEVVSKIKWNDLLRKAEEFEIIDGGMFAKELGAVTGSGGVLKGKIPGKWNPTDTKNFIGYKKGSEIGSIIEGHDRFIHFASQVKNGMTFEDAAKSVNEFLFDYSDLTFFEMNVMKRVFPYYTWLRKNSQLQLTQMLEQPDKYRFVSKVIGGVEGMTNKEDRIQTKYISDFAQDWVQLPFSVINERGQKEPILFNPNLPYLDINRIPDLTNIGGSARDLFTQTNPLIKLPIELAANKNFYFDNQIAGDDENRIMRSGSHMTDQLGLVPQLKGFVNKSGIDWGLHALKNVTGLTTTAYDYEGFKRQKIDEIKKKQGSINRRLGR